MSFKVSWKMHLLCNLLGVLIMLPLMSVVNRSNEQLLSSRMIFAPTPFVLINYGLYLLGTLAVVILVHEGLHGLCFRLFGGKVKYSYRIFYAYTQETSGLPLSRIRFLIVLLTPLVALSLLVLPWGDFFSGMALVFNLTGATGDLIMAFFVLRCPRNCLIIDRRYGFDVVIA